MHDHDEEDDANTSSNTGNMQDEGEGTSSSPQNWNKETDDEQMDDVPGTESDENKAMSDGSEEEEIEEEGV